VFIGAEPQSSGTIAPVEPLVVAEAILPIRTDAPRRRVRWHRVVAAVVIMIAAGNLALLALTGVARAVVDHPPTPAVEGVGSLRTVDSTVLRGANPTHTGYENLRDAGVTTVVDLRAEVGAHADDEFVRKAPGAVFVHCGAGVGRTGVIAARYLVETGQSSPLSALGRNLEVGPPSVEQNAYSLGIDLGPLHPGVVAVSRFLDAPRRILHYF
jgi:hypothetical protein